jgi:hypothetical protein
MDIRGWDQRYRSKERLSEDFDTPPTPLLIETASRLKAGKALDPGMRNRSKCAVARCTGLERYSR